MSWIRSLGFRAKNQIRKCSQKPFSFSGNFSEHCFWESKILPAEGNSNCIHSLVEAYSSTNLGTIERKRTWNLLENERKIFEKKFQLSIPNSQCRDFSTSKYAYASESSETPVSSPLFMGEPVKKQTQTKEKAKIVQAVLSGYRQSPKKVNLVAALVRGMRVEDALIQMQVSSKRAAKVIFKLITAARANASHNHGLNKDKLIIDEAYVGKSIFLKRMNPHGRGKSGILHHPHTNITVKVREITEAEEKRREREDKNKWTAKYPTKLVPHRIKERRLGVKGEKKGESNSNDTTIEASSSFLSSPPSA